MCSIFKKFILAFLTLLFIQIPSFAEEVSKLYLIKDSKINNIKSVADFYSRQNNFNVTAEPEYSVVYINDKTYYVTFFEQTGKDVYFYYYTPNELLNDYKNIIARIKKRGISCKREKNKPTIKLFYNKVKAIMNRAIDLKNDVSFMQTYDFSDSAQEKYDKISKVLEIKPIQTPQLETAKDTTKKLNIFVEKDNYVTLKEPQYIQQPEVITPSNIYDIPGGLTMNVVIQSDIDTSSLAQNDRISAILQEDLYYNNKIKAKSGSIIYGSVIEVKSAGGGYRNGSLVLKFDSLLTTEGEKLSLKTENVNFTLPETKRAAKITGQVAGRAAAGAIGGLLLGLTMAAFSSNSSSLTKGIAYGAAIGAGAGAISGGISAATAKGEDVSVSEGTVLVLKTISY